MKRKLSTIFSYINGTHKCIVKCDIRRFLIVAENNNMTEFICLFGNWTLTNFMKKWLVINVTVYSTKVLRIRLKRSAME